MYGSAPGVVRDSASFQQARAAVASSIVAAACDVAISPRARALLVRLARAIGVVDALASGAVPSAHETNSAAIVMPTGIFPLPAASGGLAGHRRKVAEATSSRGQRREEIVRLATELAGQRQAVEDLLSSFAHTGTATRSTRARAFELPAASRSMLATETQHVLGEAGFGSGPIDVAHAISVLEHKAARIARTLHASRGGATPMVKIGDVLLPADVFGLGDLVLVPDDRAVGLSPGPCPPSSLTEAEVDDTPPTPSGHGDARILGIADLLMVEQELVRYELGDIAHIENVLKSELRARTFRTATTTETSQQTETETTEEKQRDLSTGERFNLQTESQNVIAESTSKDAGITITASYGPSVEASSSFNASAQDSSQSSTSTSSSFARDVTSRALSRLQSRALTRRFVKTVQETEETNKHEFDNQKGAHDISGVYRFVDKIYRAQVVNYGKRLMLEFVVPEPAAFLRYAIAHQPVEGVTLECPKPPGYCLANGTFAPLQASDVKADNYMYWASEYRAEDVEPPPPTSQIVGASKKSPEQMVIAPGADGPKLSSEVLEISLPDGYNPVSAIINLYGETQSGTHRIVYQIQGQQGEYLEPPDDHAQLTLYPQPTTSLPISINSIGFHNYEIVVTVFTVISDEKTQAWQLKTYNSIMNAYRGLKTAYDRAIDSARIQASYAGVSGTNPFVNRETEKIELKRACISIMSAQRFEAFDAMATNVSPFGYPEIDFVQAKAEGIYIQFFEQGLDWTNMTYLFYPYFWSRKSEWPVRSQLSDNDPLFSRFLQAGAARVQVPVRQGSEAGVLHYLASGEVWLGDGTLVTAEDGEPDPVHLSLLDELKSQLGNSNRDGVGTVTVSSGSAIVGGVGTAFSADDVRKRIVIRGATFVIARVNGPTEVVLETAATGPSATDLPYSLGPKLVGSPWDVKVPTNLIKLDSQFEVG